SHKGRKEKRGKKHARGRMLTEATGYITRKIKDMLQEKTAKYFLKYRHDGRTSHLTGRNKNMGWK
ncbi:hypothetical protein, partial [Phocaeicola vulgatus]